MQCDVLQCDGWMLDAYVLSSPGRCRYIERAGQCRLWIRPCGGGGGSARFTAPISRLSPHGKDGSLLDGITNLIMPNHRPNRRRLIMASGRRRGCPGTADPPPSRHRVRPPGHFAGPPCPTARALSAGPPCPTVRALRRSTGTGGLLDRPITAGSREGHVEQLWRHPR